MPCVIVRNNTYLGRKKIYYVLKACTIKLSINNILIVFNLYFNNLYNQTRITKDENDDENS